MDYGATGQTTTNVKNILSTDIAPEYSIPKLSLHEMTEHKQPQLSAPNGIDLEELSATVYDLIKDIRDPEKPETLEQLSVVYEDGVMVTPLNRDSCLIKIEFIPTVPHCSLATMIGLCMRTKLDQCLPHKHKVDINIKKGMHNTADEINKQINDKERVAAALENPNLLKLVMDCIKDVDR